jgi:hypothetical protein
MIVIRCKFHCQQNMDSMIPENRWSPLPQHILGNYLFAHGLRVCHSCAEKSIPLQASIQSSPMVVSVTGVRETPGDQSIVLPVHWITRFPISTATHSTQFPCRWFSILHVMMQVLPGMHKCKNQRNTIDRGLIISCLEKNRVLLRKWHLCWIHSKVI